MWPFSDLVVMQDPLSKSLVQHLSVPLLEPLGLGYLLVSRVAVENVVISFTGWTGPDVTRHIPEEGDKICQPLSTRRISISWKGVNCSLLTPVSSHTPGSLLRSHGTLQSLAHVVWRSEYCRGMICKPVCKANMEKLATHRGATHTTYKSKAARKSANMTLHFFAVVLPGIWKRALWAVLLDMHAKETNVHPVYFLKCKKCFGSVREGLHHLAWVHKPEETEKHKCI